MRWFTLIVSVVFVVIGIVMIRDGTAHGWTMTIFFGCCLLVAVLDPWLPRPWLAPEYHLVITDDEVACEHRKRERESIRWNDVNRIWLVTTSQGPRLPDQWILFEGARAGCSFPTEAEGMDAMWDEFENRFPGFDYGPLIKGGTTDARHLCWERQVS